MSETREARRRAQEMLRLAANLIASSCPDATVFYDEAECDGACIAEDCRAAADDLAEAQPERPTPEPCEPDCVLCSGEACERHGHDPCACDTLDRHTKPPTPEQWERRAREVLWLGHGCPISALYGDDGEMQCNHGARHGFIDFKREPWDQIQGRLLAAATPEPERPAYSPVGQQQATSDSTNFVMPLERPAARCVWTDIRTAPKDRWILLWGAGWRDGGKPVTVPELAVWSEFSHCFITHEGEVQKPTHWCDYEPVPLVMETPHA